MLPAFPASLRGALWIVPEVTAAFVATFSTGHNGEFMIARKTSLVARNARTTLSGDLALLLLIHRSKSAF